MKKSMLLALFFISVLSCKAQIVPVEKVIEYINANKSYPTGTTYIKDVNNLLDKYTGTWKGSLDGINYEIQVIKATTQFRERKIDKLFIKMYITKTDGTVLEDTRALPIENLLVIQGSYLNGLVYNLDYYGRNSKCGQSGYVSMKVLENTGGKQLRIGASWDDILLSEGECTGPRPKCILPKRIILDKQ
jgi:uncharacterized membrane protein